LTAAKLDMARLRHAMFNGARSTDLNLRLAHLADTIDRVIVFKRAMIEELSPSALHHLGLHTALDIVVTALCQRTGIEVALDATDIELEPAVRTVAFRVVEACLDNIERHAAVKVAQVRVLVEGEQLQIQVCDAGAGFVPGDGPDAKHGLANLRHRLESIGGQLRITSAPGQGTQVQASLPLHLDPGRASGGVHQASDQPDGPGPGMPAA
jgi:signal transduction histidine kinase